MSRVPGVPDDPVVPRWIWLLLLAASVWLMFSGIFQLGASLAEKSKHDAFTQGKCWAPGRGGAIECPDGGRP